MVSKIRCKRGFTREEMKFLTALDGGLESNNQAVIRMTGGVPLKPHDSSIKRHLSRCWNGKNGNSGENACSPAQKKPSGQTARARGMHKKRPIRPNRLIRREQNERNAGFNRADLLRASKRKFETIGDNRRQRGINIFLKLLEAEFVKCLCFS